MIKDLILITFSVIGKIYKEKRIAQKRKMLARNTVGLSNFFSLSAFILEFCYYQRN